MGVPPLTGVAVNETEPPWQIVVALAVKLTEGVKTGFTVIITYALAEEGDTQGWFDIMVTQIVSWSLIDLVVNVGELVPTAVPFFLHV